MRRPSLYRGRVSLERTLEILCEAQENGEEDIYKDTERMREVLRQGYGFAPSPKKEKR